MSRFQIPKELVNKYVIINTFSSGGSAGKTLLIKHSDGDGSNRILKYAQWEGIGYNGIPWVESQAKRLKVLKKVIPQPAKLLLPSVYELHKSNNLIYFTSESYDNAVPLSSYYLHHKG